MGSVCLCESMLCESSVLGFWPIDLPGGKKSKNPEEKTAEQTLVRECREELGVVLSALDYLFLDVINVEVGDVIYPISLFVYCGTHRTIEEWKESANHELEFVTMQEINDNIDEYSELLRMIALRDWERDVNIARKEKLLGNNVAVFERLFPDGVHSENADSNNTISVSRNNKSSSLNLTTNDPYTNVNGFMYGTPENRYIINDQKGMAEFMRNPPRVDREFRIQVEDAVRDRTRGRKRVSAGKKLISIGLYLNRQGARCITAIIETVMFKLSDRPMEGNQGTTYVDFSTIKRTEITYMHSKKSNRKKEIDNAIKKRNRQLEARKRDGDVKDSHAKSQASKSSGSKGSVKDPAEYNRDIISGTVTLKPKRRSRDAIDVAKILNGYEPENPDDGNRDKNKKYYDKKYDRNSHTSTNNKNRNGKDAGGKNFSDKKQSSGSSGGKYNNNKKGSANKERGKRDNWHVRKDGEKYWW